jgi:hypothetical protein
MKRFSPFFRLPRPVCICALLTAPLLGQGKVAITSITRVGGDLTLIAKNTPTVPATAYATTFVLQSSTTLKADSWKTVNATFSTPEAEVGGKTTKTTITLPAGQPKCFYRVIGILGTALDTDGDGLSNDFEDDEKNPHPTNPTLYDSDFDGFCDGQEAAYGTSPASSSSAPVFVSNIATANFALADSTATEGTSPQQLQVMFDQPFTGTLKFAINSLSSGVAGTDYTLGGSPTATTGSVSVSGTSAMIPITLVDDLNASGQRSIVVDLTLNGEVYFIGGRSSHVILLNDNDAWWTGTLAPASGDLDARTFRLKIARQNGVSSAVFGSGAGQDGLPIPVVTAGGGAPAISATNLSSSLIPIGTWPATGVEDSATRFHADSPVLTIPAAAGSILNQALKRQLVLDCQPSSNSQSQRIPDVRYIGTYVETLSSVTGTPISTQPGGFILMRDIPKPVPPRSPLLP